MKKFLYLIPFCLVLFMACDRNRRDNVLEDLSGVRRITHYELIEMDSLNRFSKVITDTSNIGDLILWNNNSDVLNNMTVVGNPAISSWSAVGIKPSLNPMGWYADFEELQTLTFWSSNAMEEKFRVTYTLSHSLFYKKLQLETVFVNANGKRYKEKMELSRL